MRNLQSLTTFNNNFCLYFVSSLIFYFALLCLFLAVSTGGLNVEANAISFVQAFNQVVTQEPNNYTFSPYYQHSRPVAAIFIFAYVLIFFLCMIGNLLVCLIVVKNRQMRTVTNIFILNLAISDLLVGILCLPITLADNLVTGGCSACMHIIFAYIYLFVC